MRRQRFVGRGRWFARIPWLVAAALTLGLLATMTSWASEEEGKPDTERLADLVGAERCFVPSGRTGVIHTCEFGDGEPKQCYEAEWVPNSSVDRERRELEFRATLRHEGACTRNDKA